MAFPIEVRQLVYCYPGAQAPAVDRLDVILRRGEILGLLGPNGAGKTTTLHAILGLLVPTAGTVRVFGASPVDERTRVLPRLNFASVDVDLPSNLTASECLFIFAQLYQVAHPHETIDGLLKQFELSKFRRQVIGTLSAGEQMRLKLCKALLNAPELLILDEPTLSLDPYMAKTVRDLLKMIQQERQLAILHTSHNMQEVATFCERIVFLHHGKKLAEGAPQEVLERFKSHSLDELFIRAATGGELFSTSPTGS